jgi:hypothetical protein
MGTERLTPIQRLGVVSRQYEEMADAYRQVALDAAVAEAAHKTARAKVILNVKAVAKGESERISHAEAETRAEADDNVAALFLERLTTAALADSHREKLRQLREQVATGRTAVASERAADAQHAAGLTGAA